MNKKLKRVVAVGLAATIIMPLTVGAEVSKAAENSDTEKFVMLDGEWHFKLYRTYNKMFQYFPYNMVQVTWEDEVLSRLPSQSVWSLWESVQMPADDVTTGGLLPLEREDTAEFEAEAETKGENETEMSVDAKVESETETGSEIETWDEPEAGNEIGSGTETESIETECDTEVQSETDAGITPVHIQKNLSKEPAWEDTRMFPSWSEAWVCRSFELPADFTEDESVTLILGIIDDMDVVYINGQLVAGSGFKDGSGSHTLNIPETGGFDYTNADKSKQVMFEKSYWEETREYKIPTDCLNIGGSNEICIRIYNNNGFGGFYSGNPYAICGSEAAVREVKGLPSDEAESPELKQFVDEQNKTLESEDISAYEKTIYDAYHNDGEDKALKLKNAEEAMAAYDDVQISDENIKIYRDGENLYWYSAHRTISALAEDGSRQTLSEDNIEVCYLHENGHFYERGNWNRCYTKSYDSGLFNKELKYSIYLPPSYYTDVHKTYPVVYLLHGINSSSESFVKVDGIYAFMDHEIALGNIAEMIVVMPDSGKNSFYRDTEYDENKPDETGPWQTHITTEIRQEVESNYRTINDAKFRGLTGISMGGFGSLSIGALYPKLYSSIASHMGAVNDEALSYLKTLSKEEIENYDFYFDCGLQDTMVKYEWTVNVHEYLEGIGKEHDYDLRDGGHNSAFYMAGMPDSMKMHSDHFMKNGLFDAVLTETEGVFDLYDKSDNHKDIKISVKLSGNKIVSIDGLTADDYTVNGDNIVISEHFLEKLDQDIVLNIRLYSGKILKYTVKVIDTSEIGQTEESKETEESRETTGTNETQKKPEDTNVETQNRGDTPVKTGDKTPVAILFTVMTAALITAGAAAIVIVRKKKER